MSSAPAPEPPAEEHRPPRPAHSLIFDDPFDQRSSDDTDRGWGEEASEGSDRARDLARFLDEKPPHHI